MTISATASYKDSVALITGGTGSFGRHMTNRLLALGCKEIRILSRDEAKQESMRLEYANDILNFLIGDVRSWDSVNKAMRGVDFVFHAAALKQIPSCEFFPIEAVKTNILGVRNVVDSAIAHGVSQAIFLSTDKAVMPVNSMGMTKALMEKTVQASSRSLTRGETIVSCTRYGNVMCSRGSVIPLFMKQIREGKPLTITEPSMTRFMLSLTDAIDLVEFAFQNARQGDVFVKKAPACTVQELAEIMLEIFQANNPIQVIGMRHGEKLHEVLASAEEIRRAEDLQGNYRISLDTRDLNYSKYFTEGDPQEAVTEDYTSENTQQLTRTELRDLLYRLPEIRAELENLDVNSCAL